MKQIIKEWLGITSLENRIETLENLVMDEESKLNGFATLKEHLQEKR